jgi:hypothetical protein
MSARMGGRSGTSFTVIIRFFGIWHGFYPGNHFVQFLIIVHDPCTGHMLSRKINWHNVL